MNYARFLASKAQLSSDGGFDPIFMPEILFDFQQVLVNWAIRRGRAAIFADCGMGKTPMQLVWAENVVRKTGGRVLIATPLAVAHQTVEEGAKFGIDCARSPDGTRTSRIVVTNYERLHYFDPTDFTGMVLDESSILKSFDGARRSEITEFMRRLPYRLLCTATAAPNDYIELGTSSEALGEFGHVDMLTRFFKNDRNNISQRGAWKGQDGNIKPQWRFKGHAEVPFWRWVSSWARAMRKPSDLGFADGPFKLPALDEQEHLVEARTLPEGMLFDLPAQGLVEQREEKRRTINERCEKVAELVVGTKAPALVWCHMNAEGDLLERLIPGAVQVAGADSDDAKEEKLLAFAHGKARVLVTKPKIGAWGLNFQHCAHVTYFPSHSFEQYYQAIRRCWRFGQKHPVRLDIITTEGDGDVFKNLRRKSAQADAMFNALTAHMNDAVRLDRRSDFPHTLELPTWL